MAASLRNVKLHVYSHCPYCVRITLALGWLKIPYDIILYGYGDMSLVEKFGKKVLPVLECEHVLDDKKKSVQMRESLDIVRFLDTLPNGNAVNASLAPPTGRFDDWIQRLKPMQRILCRERITRLPEQDWAKPEDVEYAHAKWSKQNFDYESSLTPQVEGPAIAGTNSLLVELSGMIANEHGANQWGRSLDEIILLPELRTLSVHKKLEWPEDVRKYLDVQFADCKSPLYFEMGKALDI